jgi:hypothetical protein
MVKDYEEYDWEDLPEKIQAAYKVLGYDEEMWDYDKDAPSEDKDWEELTEAEQKAAKVRLLLPHYMAGGKR